MLRSLLRRSSGTTLVGTFLKLPVIETCELAKLAGFDFVILDHEHAMFGLRELNSMIAVARGLDLPPVVRVADHGYADAQKLLDAGAAGILVPHVNSGEECRRVLSSTLHPPAGTRGAGGTMRAGGWGLGAAGVDYLADSRTEVARIPMIETGAGVDDIDAILATPGVDAIFVGPADLSLSMGVGRTDERLAHAIEHVRRRAVERRVPVGTLAPDVTAGRRMIAAGYDFIAIGSDTALLGRAATELVQQLRA